MTFPQFSHATAANEQLLLRAVLAGSPRFRRGDPGCGLHHGCPVRLGLVARRAIAAGVASLVLSNVGVSHEENVSLELIKKDCCSPHLPFSLFLSTRLGILQ